MAYSGTEFEVALSNDLGGDAFTITNIWAPRGFGDLGRMAIYFQGAGEH